MFSNEINSDSWSKIRHQKSLILGGSKGFGRAISGHLVNSKELSRSSRVESVDFSRPESLSKIIRHMDDYSPEFIFYVAGGGVHGEYFSKPMHSHRWTFEVNFFRPIEIADYLKHTGFQGIFVYIGSSIAERSDSKNSISYAESKKLALKTLLSLDESELKVRVFSPPYMDTALLPKKAWPRLETPDLVLNPKKVAKVLLNWLSESPLKDTKTLSENFDPRHFDWMQRFTYSLPTEKDI